ncbi:MAG: GAF domain-containing protein, partial [Planctomycetota bacterium]
MRGDYRRKAALARIHTTLDSFYLRQEIDWDYDIRKLLDHILEIALNELEFGEKGRKIDRGLIIVRPEGGGEYEVQAGWGVEGEDLQFSRTVMNETLDSGGPVLYENASNDPRFINAESLKALEVVSLMSVPIEADSKTLGAIYVERRDSSYVFGPEDVAFLASFSETIAPYVKTALIHQEHVAAIR